MARESRILRRSSSEAVILLPVSEWNHNMLCVTSIATYYILYVVDGVGN
jgi:hypothetical protein